MVHRHGSGVPGLAGKAAVQAARAVDGFHHAQRQPFLLQARPLLNMQFQIGAEILLTARGMRTRAGSSPTCTIACATLMPLASAFSSQPCGQVPVSPGCLAA
jgi:hypothetical protein